jgi:hypothetical protein
MTVLRFFIVGGVVLVLSGLLQVAVRPRKGSEHKVLNRGTVWAAFCVAVGVAAILVGAGVVPVSGLAPGR